jgi:ribosomal protein S18 acetylase RimI-like enzyme
MEITPLHDSDWLLFLDWAGKEGWRVPAREVELFRGPLAACALALRENNKVRGFVTAVPHQQSGWIGNLIIDPAFRGRGMGALLFEHALQSLQGRGVRSVWLTASVLGRPIYVRRGFVAAGTIVRWVRPGGFPGRKEIPTFAAETLFAADARTWGESRRPLLDFLLEGSRIFLSGGTSALLQGGKDLQILGPWYSPSLCPRENRRLIATVLDAAESGTELVADVLADSPVQPLLAAAGFAASGSCDLMVHGHAAELSAMVALASLGSIG